MHRGVGDSIWKQYLNLNVAMYHQSQDCKFVTASEPQSANTYCHKSGYECAMSVACIYWRSCAGCLSVEFCH